jgi:hypothetical protein
VVKHPSTNCVRAKNGRKMQHSSNPPVKEVIVVRDMIVL